MNGRSITLIGFGSQGQAWAENLRDSGWAVRIAHENPGQSRSALLAESLGFETVGLQSWSERPAESSEGAWVAFMCPDQEIGRIYREFFSSRPEKLNLILAHGFAVYGGLVEPKNHPQHHWHLLAPKAIGPRLRSEFVDHRPHSLHAAVFSDVMNEISEVAVGLGFRRENLVEADFMTETIGDLISEQTLLCGGVFTLLEATAKEMQRAGVPADLAREECISELELVASLIRELGPAKAFEKISIVAQVGAVDFRRRLKDAGVEKLVSNQAERVRDGRFLESLSATERWQTDRKHLLESLGSAFNPKADSTERVSP